MTSGFSNGDIAKATVLPASATDDPTLRALEAARSVAVARSKHTRDQRRDERNALVLGGSFAVIALLLAVVEGPPSLRTLFELALIAVVYSITTRVVFESVGGDALAAQSVFVVALFVVPPLFVPAAMIAGLLLEWVLSRPQPSVVGACSAVIGGWHSVGPVAVLVLADATPASIEHWPWYLLALAAQFLVDALVAVLRCSALGIPAASLARPLAWTFAVDALLAPVGMAAVLATSSAAVALVLASAPVGLLALLARDRAAHLERAVAISNAYEQAISLATTDSLTELANRRAWTEAVARAAIMHAAAPDEYPVTVLMADLDGLKPVNDTFGHEAGDLLIRAAAEVLAAAAPEGALVARLGGDEFGVLVTGTRHGDELADEVRRRCAQYPAVSGSNLSISIGIASCPPLVDVEEAVAVADRRAASDKTERRMRRG